MARLFVSMDRQTNEWCDLDHCSRNLLMWPDFLKWKEQSRFVEIKRDDSNGSLGLVSVDVQDQETKEWYHITKRVKKDHPAESLVNLYEWIYEVDGVATTNCPRDEFVKLVNNGRNAVRFTLKEAHDPLGEFVKQWGKEKTVTLNLKEGNNFKDEFKLAHFYSKGNNETQDHILVWESKPDSAETDKPLYRGDELLQVNGKAVAGEKLAGIHKLIFNEANTEVKMKFKEIQHKICNEVKNRPNTQSEVPCQYPCQEENTSPKLNDERTQCTKEMDENAGQTSSKAYVNNVGLHGSQGDINSPNEEVFPEEATTPTAERKKPKRSIKRLFSKDHDDDTKQVGNDIAVGDLKNEGYADSPRTQRKAPMCKPCLNAKESPLPKERELWPIDKIELGCFREICELLDLEERNRNNTSILSALGCFSQNEAEKIKKQAGKGGDGHAPKIALGRWGTNDLENNVGALKKILENSLARSDVLQKFTKWEEMSVCHGCGVQLDKSH